MDERMWFFLVSCMFLLLQIIKLKMGGKTTAKDFVQANSNDLPEMDSICLKKYLKNSDYLAPEMKNFKTEISTRPEYGDIAVGFVQLYGDKNQCTVEAEVTPETSTRAQSYRVQGVVKESLLVDNEIVDAICFGCVASASWYFVRWLIKFPKFFKHKTPTFVISDII